MPETPTRLEAHRLERKSATHARILAASEILFSEDGYEATSLDDIARAADVARRTLYLHFPNKAAILLAHFDSWLDAFVEAFAERPFDEPVIDSLEAVMSVVTAGGWMDPAVDSGNTHPFIEWIVSGPPELAGHILQQWIVAQDRIAAASLPPTQEEPSTEDRLRAVARARAVFLVWYTAILAARDPALTDESRNGATGVFVYRHIAQGSI